jgi:hypothetical protein
MMENHNYDEIIGVSSAPYINNTLAAQGALMTNSFAIEHPSEPNYLDIFSGSNQGVTDDTFPPPGSPYTTPDLGGELIKAGFTFGGYSEDMPSVGYTGDGPYGYAGKHNPMVDFADVPAADNMPYAGYFPTDFTKLPTFSFVVPNLVDDMHDGTVSQGDTWLKNNIEPYRQWAQTHNSLLIVTWDEDDNGNNQIATIFDGQMVKQGQYSEYLDHFGVLRTIEDMYGLPYAGASATATTISDIFVSQGTGTHLNVSAPATTTAGSSFSITITAQDSNNQTLTSYLGTVHFTSSDSLAVLPSDYTFTATDAGVHTFTGIVLETAASQSITATDTGTSSITGNASVTVNAAAASSLVVAGYSSPSTAGTSHSFTVTARDAFGNTAGGYRGTVTFSTSDAQGVLPSNYTFTAADAGQHSFSATLKTSGTQSITATDTVNSTIKGSQTGMTINPATASKLLVGSYVSPTTAGSSHGFTVTAQDAFGNTAAGYTGTVAFTSSDPQAVLPGNYKFTSSDTGVHSFSATLKTAGSQSITATDTANSSIAGADSGISVIPAAIQGLQVTAPGSVTAGQAFTITVSAVDPFNNVIGTYLGTVHFSSSDSQAALPADYTFKASDAGVHVFTNGVTLKTAGSQTLTATDTVTSSLTGQATITVNSGTLTPALFARSSSDGQVWAAVSNGSSAFITSSWAVMSTGVTWADVLMGDFNGDGKTDIVARAAQSGDVWVGLSTGSTFQFSRWTTWSTGVNWVDVRVGDFNGDGKADLVARVQQTGQWWIGQSNGSAFSESLWATWSTGASWTGVSVGDFNGDGKDDMAGFCSNNGQWWVAQSTGKSFTTTLWASWSTGATWVDFQVADFNGDGKADITARALQNGQWYAAISNGSNAFNTALWASWSTGATWVDVKVGDFNGDGKSDIIARASQNGQWYVGLSNGSAFTTSLWASWSTGATWVDVQVGDFNGDGKSDLTARALENGQWYTGLSSNSGFSTKLWAAWSTGVTWLDVRLAKNL